MRRRMSFCLLLAILQVIIWFSSATSRPYAYSLGFASSQQFHEFTQDGVVFGSEEVTGKLNRLGSRPPSCRLKCEGCVPCDAIQIPESEIKGHVHVQYANYEPEGWKCKCGLSIFNP